MKKRRAIFLLLFIPLAIACASAKDIERDKKYLSQYQKSDPGNIQKVLDTLFDSKIRNGMSNNEVANVLGPPLAQAEHYLEGGQGSLGEWVYKEGVLIFHNGRLINVSYKVDGKLYLPSSTPYETR